MALDSESFNKDLYDLLKVRGYKPVPLNSQNQRVPASQSADVIQFTFVKDGKDYGKAWVTIDDAQNVIVYYDDEQQDTPSTTTPGVEYDDTWTGFLKHVKNWAQRRQLSFELSNKDRLGDDMKQREFYKMKEKLGESKQLDELSPDTMKSYKDKATAQRKAEIHKTLDKTNPASVRDAAMHTQGKRARGIFNADKKLGTFKDPNWGKGDDNAWIKRDAQAGLAEARTDQFGYEIKGNKKPWGLYHTKPNKPEKLISKHHNKNAAEAAKWDQLGMGSTAKGEKFTVKKIPEKAEPIKESYHPMGKKASYNDAVPNVKIILQHNRSLEEGEQRYRNVARIYLENTDGERFLAPTTKPGIARVYARHIAEGGLPNDERWNHIKSICEDYNKMAGFARAVRGKQFNESAQRLVAEGIAHYDSLRETLHKLTGHRGYNAYFESWTPPLMENDSDESINELFVQETVDPRIESAMPILSRLHKKVAEMAEVDVLEGWADSIISEKLELDSTTKSMAVPADEMLDEAPGAATLAHNQSTEKSNLKALGLAEMDKEHGSSRDFDGPRGQDKTAKPMSVKQFAKGALKSLRRGMKGWEKGMHDVDTVKAATKSLSPDQKEKALAAKVGKGSPAELQQKLIKREKNKQVDENSTDRNRNRKMKMATDYEERAKKTSSPIKKDHYRKMADEIRSSIVGDEGKLDEVLDTRNAKMSYAKKNMDSHKAALDKFIQSPDQKEKALSTKAGKGSPAELQQKLIKREKNKKVDEVKDVEEAKAKKPKFVVFDNFEAWENQMHQLDAEYDETDIDGKLVGLAVVGAEYNTWGYVTKPGNTIGVWYNKAGMGTFVKSNGYNDVVDYVETDPNWPYDNDDGDDDFFENLDKNQKKVGQLGPTEVVKNNNIGKLVGASESVEYDAEIARIAEMAGIKNTQNK